MAQTQYRRTNTTEYYDSNLQYIAGSAVPVPWDDEVVQPQKKQASRHVVRNRKKSKRMSPGYILFLTFAMAVTACTLILYVRLQAQITNNVTTISRMERELNTLKLSNDEAYSRASGNVDLEEIKRIAIGELGMTYATEGQIITYSEGGSDYVKQVADIP